MRYGNEINKNQKVMTAFSFCHMSVHDWPNLLPENNKFAAHKVEILSFKAIRMNMHEKSDMFTCVICDVTFAYIYVSVTSYAHEEICNCYIRFVQ